MKDRRVLAALAALLVFAMGFALGYWARGGVAGRPESGALAEIAHGASADPGSSRVRSAASEEEGAAPGRAAAARGAEGDAPAEGRGGVSVIGRAESARPPTVTSADPIERGQGERPPLDGGAPRGTLDREAIRDVVRSHRDQLGFCFSWQLHSHPELRGRIVMEFVIGEDGSVIGAEVADDQLGDETVLTCFQGVTRRMRFPAPEGGTVRVRYPFELSPDEQPEQP